MACSPCIRLIHSLPASSYSAMVHHAMGAIKSPFSVIDFKGQPTVNPHGKSNSLKEAQGDPSLPMGYNDYASQLQVCSNTKSLIMGKQLHSQMLITGQEKSIFLAAKLLTMYTSCGSLEDARQVFDKLCEPNASQALDQVHNSNVFLWNAMIKGYAQGGAREEALGLYYQMRETGMQPDNFTFTLVLKVCAVQSALQEGMEIHDDIMRAGIELDVFVGTALLDMYAKCGSAEVARKLFDKLPHRDQVSWNAMIAGYAQNGLAEEALKLFGDMRMAGVKPNPVTMIAGYAQNGQACEVAMLFYKMRLAVVIPSSVTLLSLLPAFVDSRELQHGVWIHAYIIKSGFESNIFVGNTLMDVYAKCERIELAREVFDKMSERMWSPGQQLS